MRRASTLTSFRVSALAWIAFIAYVVLGSPYYEPGLLGPAGVAFGLYGYGWYTPYSSNPYILTQGATDQFRIERALSDIAIRFEEAPQ